MFYRLTYPWESISVDLRSEIDTSDNNIPWCSQVILQKGKKITNATTGANFPIKQISKTLNVFELPGPAIKGDISRHIAIDIDNIQKFNLHFFDSTNIDSNSKQAEQFELFFDRIMNAMLFLFRACLHADEYKKYKVYWDQILDEIHKNKDDDPAKYALVVDLARLPELIHPIDRITEKPKRVLQRVHAQERIQKVQEVDIKCIIDLARRPGSILAEKAGAKQRILAIKRTEKINILENRVTKHCCSLAAKAAKRYLNEHEKININKSPRKKMVLKLFKESKRLPLKSTFSDVVNLLEPCRQPNYTLMQNADYYKVWKAYIQLVKNEDLRADLWQWNRRMWADYMGLFLSDILFAFQKKMTDKSFLGIGEKTVFGKRKHEAGLWFLTDTLPGPYIVNPDSSTPGTLYFIQGDYDTLINLSESLAELSVLNADYLLIYFHSEKKIVLPIYGILPPHHLSNKDRGKYVNDLLPSLIKNIRNFNNKTTKWACKSGWALLGNWGKNKPLDKIQNLGEDIKCWTSEVNPDYNAWDSQKVNYFEPLMNITGIQ